MGVDGLENVPENPVNTPADDEVAERIHRDGGEAEKQEQEARREQDHEERRERLSERTSADQDEQVAREAQDAAEGSQPE